jgi:hypothetical protein
LSNARAIAERFAYLPPEQRAQHYWLIDMRHTHIALDKSWTIGVHPLTPLPWNLLSIRRSRDAMGVQLWPLISVMSADPASATAMRRAQFDSSGLLTFAAG